MDAHSLFTKLSPKNIDPVYLLHGEEYFLIGQIVEKLKKIVLDGPMADLNYRRIKGGQASGSEIRTFARELPMMAKKRMIVVDDAQKVSTKDLEELDPYLAEPVDQTCLVLIADKFDLRRGALNRANKRGQVHKAERLKEKELNGFVNGRAKSLGLKLDPKAAHAIVLAVGSDCAALDDAIERVGLYAGKDATITEDDVASVVSAMREHSAFELVDAIGGRQPQKALSLLTDLFSQREAPIMLNALLARHYRQLLVARIHLHARTPESQLPSLLGAPPFAVRKLVEQSRRFRGAELERALARLGRADKELKSSRRSPDLVLTQAVLDLCR